MVLGVPIFKHFRVVGQEPTVLAVGVGWGCLKYFSLALGQYRQKYCLKESLNQKQPAYHFKIVYARQMNDLT